MKIASPCFSEVIEIPEGTTFELVLENQNLFRSFLGDLRFQFEGGDGSAVLSVDNTPVSISKNVDILDNFAPFDINTKTMLSKISSFMEKTAVDEEHLLQTSALIAEIENYMYELSFSFPFRTECRKLNISSVIKAVSVFITDDGKSAAETVVNYMTALTELDKSRIFIAVNVRCFFSDGEISEIVKETETRQLRLLLLENTARTRIDGVERLTVDSDLCEF